MKTIRNNIFYVNTLCAYTECAKKISVYFEALQRSNFEVETFYNTA